MNRIGRTAHKYVSRHLLLPLQRARSYARPALRPLMRAYYEGLRFRQESALWSADRKRDWMLQRLRLSLRRAYQETSFYRERFDSLGFDPRADFSFADFAALPVLEKEDLREAGKAILSSAVPADQLVKDATGGSTGAPVEIYLGPEERGWRESAGSWFHEQIGLPQGSRTALFWGHHLDPVQRDGWRDRYSAFINHQRWFDCFRLSQETLARYHQEFEHWRPACIIAYAAALGALAEFLEERGDAVPVYPDICFVTGAEKLLPHHREIIEAVFRRPVHERYGSRDIGYIGYQMAPRRGLEFTLDWANLYVEPESSAKTSAILITKLHGDGLPMIRYRIGDVGHFPAGQPGHPNFVLHEVLGRDTDRIWLESGRWITGLQLPHLLKDFAVREFQFVQQADYSIELSIIPQNGFGAESREGLLKALRLNLGDLPVRILLVDHIERTRANKWRPVISHVTPMECKAS